MLEVTGNLIEAQIVETLLLSIINYQTLVCSKASRIVETARPATIVDFGLRRAPGPEAGVRAARAAFIAGAIATSNVEAGRRFGIPISGTHAHSFVMAFPTELEAFRAWCKAYPEGTTLLIDTYDVVQGARNACQVVREGAALKAVRIDSGDFVTNTRQVRTILNDAGLEHVRILVSGDMNENKIQALGRVEDEPFESGRGFIYRKRAPIDGFGVGTDMVTARPESALGGVYKLVQVDSLPCIKTSSGKATWPGAKQVWRYPDDSVDVICAYKEDAPRELLCEQGERLVLHYKVATTLLAQVMIAGRRVYTAKSASQVAVQCKEELSYLPAYLKDIECNTPPYRVEVSAEIRHQRNVAERMLKGEQDG
jgi:nicotinate phosphoribosyltransferase